MKRYEAFDTIHEAAVRGELDRDAYAQRMLAVEFEVLLEARTFYREHLDDLTAKERRDARTLWRLLRGAETLEDHLEDSRRRGGDLLEHFRRLHDTLVLAERRERLEAERER